MDTYLLRVFQEQVFIQCNAFLTASDELKQVIQVGMCDRNRTHAIRAWGLIQAMLTAAANISKLLWGQKNRHLDDRRELRTSLGFGDTSPLQDVLVRNHFEHFDERIERWWKETRLGNFVDLIIAETDPTAGFLETEIWRNFNHKTGDLIFWGDRFNLYTIGSEIQKAMPLLTEEASKGLWEPRY